MDRELKKYLTWLVIAAFVIILVNLMGCVRPQVVPIYPLDPDDRALGRVLYDSVKNVPTIGLNQRLDSASRVWVLLHEKIHISQIKEYGKGCMAFSVKYNSDASFKLSIEADAFCGVYVVQVLKNVMPDPSLEGIFMRLYVGYDGNWTPKEITEAMTCLPKPP